MNTGLNLIRAFDQPAIDLTDKNILVTGGTGSFGQAFIEHVITNYAPRRVIVFSRDEYKQHEMSLKFPKTTYPNIRYFIGDVRDAERLESAMRNVEFVIHAAAMKQVGASEYNPFECIRTNVIGAENVIRASIRAGVKKVIALSTDKAANPVNLYGASKLASDKIFVAGNYLSGGTGPRFAVVRYGNVVGSRGSVVEVFKDMIDDGCESLPITDPRMTRFWITLSQATRFVLSSLSMMAGGEVFVPKIPSMAVTDLAKAMAPDIKTHVIGIRPGEKLHETMVPGEDSRSTYELADRYILQSSLELSIATVPDRFGDAAKLVAPEFAYTSDQNTEWLDIPTLQRLLAEKGMMPAAAKAAVAE